MFPHRQELFLHQLAWFLRARSSDPDLERNQPLILFSGGPARCPGRELVLLLGSTMLVALLNSRKARLLLPDKLEPQRPLPATLSPYTLRFTLDERYAD